MKSYKLIDPHIRYSEYHIHILFYFFFSSSHVWMVFFVIEENPHVLKSLAGFCPPRKAPQPKATVPSRGGGVDMFSMRMRMTPMNSSFQGFFGVGKPPPQTTNCHIKLDATNPIPARKTSHGESPSLPKFGTDPRSCRSFRNFQWGRGGTSAPRKPCRFKPLGTSFCQARPAATSPPAGPELQP